jgi:hypothetical protein
MADERDPQGRYVDSSHKNTGDSTDERRGTTVSGRPSFLGPADAPTMSKGMGVKMNLNDMTAYSSDMSILFFNFNSMAREMQTSMLGAIRGAFFGGGNQFAWSGFMGNMATHNATVSGAFMTESGKAAFNVAMAAQTVANVIADADTTGAANIGNIVDFAFGNKDKMPADIPDYLKKNIQTTNELAAAGAGSPAGKGGSYQGDPEKDMGEPVRQADGSLLYTMTVPGPDGKPQVMTVRVTEWSTYPGGPSGTTKTVQVGDRQTERIDTSSVGGTTTTTTTTSYYDQKGKHLGDQVTGVKKESWEIDAGSVTTRTDDTSYTYSYDEDGKPKQLDETTTTDQETVGIEDQEVPVKPDIKNDPLAESRANGLG